MVDSYYFTLYLKHVPYNSCWSLIWILCFISLFLNWRPRFGQSFSWSAKIWEPFEIKFTQGLQSWILSQTCVIWTFFSLCTHFSGDMKPFLFFFPSFYSLHLLTELMINNGNTTKQRPCYILQRLGIMHDFWERRGWKNVRPRSPPLVAS